LDKTGRLNDCRDRAGCISTFSQYDDPSYIPPWTYQPGYSTGAVSANDARRAQLRAEALAVAGGEASSPSPKAETGKSREGATAELKAVIAEFSGKVVQEGDRYVYAEFEDSLTGIVDDVEFLFSLDTPIVGYRSAARKGGDDKRQRNRIRDMRKSLQASSGWKSVGRIVMD
jgi:uncharacterized protein (DUF1499 family)